GLRGVGAQVSWTLPLPWYSQLIFASQNGRGSTGFSFRNPGDNGMFFDRITTDREAPGLQDFVWIPRFENSFNLSDTQTVLAGVSGAFGSNETGANSRTQIYGADLLYKWKSSHAEGGFPFLKWQTEFMYRRFQAGHGADDSFPVAETFHDWGMYSQVLWGFKKGWVAGIRGDYVHMQDSMFTDDLDRQSRWRLSANLTWYPTEFSKIRLQYNQDFLEENFFLSGGKSSRSFSSGNSSSAHTALTNFKLMKKITLILSTILACALSAQAKLNVVATLPDFGSLAREIGGDKINLVVLAKATEDPHFVDARPSFVVSLRNADVLIDGGAELELGWLPPLLQNARNPKIEIGKPGRVQASQGIRLMNVPTNATRAAGDVHALGNPHFTVDPIIAKAIAQHIAQSFAALDPPNAAFYDGNYKKFEATINAKLQEWGAAILPFKDQHIVAYHDSWPYFAHRFGINIDIFLEPKPGIPPSPSHLAEVIAQMRR